MSKANEVKLADVEVYQDKDKKWRWRMFDVTDGRKDNIAASTGTGYDTRKAAFFMARQVVLIGWGKL